MCNPRRVVVKVSERIAESWVELVTVTQQAQTTTKGGATGTLEVPIDDLLGDLARDALPEVLADGIPGWEAVADGWECVVGPVVVGVGGEPPRFRLSATLTDEVRAAVTAEDTAVAAVDSVVHGTGEASTDVAARGAAKSQARGEASVLRQDAAREARGEAKAKADAAARSAVAAELERAAETRSVELQAEARALLRVFVPDAQREVNRLLALTYERCMERLAGSYGGTVERTQDGGKITMRVRIPG